MAALFDKVATTLRIIKFEHTLFALPFAFLGAVLAADGLPQWEKPDATVEALEEFWAHVQEPAAVA